MPIESRPVPTLTHLIRLTDECGVIQHAKFWMPDYSSGYCVDDNSRALIVACLYAELVGEEAVHTFITRYLAFIYYVQRRDGKVRNFLDYSRAFLEEEGSPDSLGRTLWALGHLAAQEDGLMIPAREMFHRALPHLTPASPPHALAYGILGLCAYGRREAQRKEAQRLVRPLATALWERFERTQTPEWRWPLPILTYGNARFPEAYLRAGALLESDELQAVGLECLAFLNEVSFTAGHLSVVGCHGWFPRGGACAPFDQQPIDAGGMVEANLTAYQLTRDPAYLRRALQALDWFYGENPVGAALYNPRTGGCHDGLHADGANANQGAESTLAYLMAHLHLYRAAPQAFVDDPAQTPDLLPWAGHPGG
jgi:hypothetical protein